MVTGSVSKAYRSTCNMDTNKQNAFNVITELQRLEELDKNSNEAQPSLPEKGEDKGIGRLGYF